MYESEFTQFMKQFLAANPDVAQERVVRRGTWWDKPVDDDFENRARDSRVKQNGYYYQGYVYQLAPKKQVEL